MRLTQRIFLLIFITVSLSSLGNFFLTQYQEYELLMWLYLTGHTT
ncbi:hypothetical protein [sulfur-oxidizing endosymbiont of Gigantopelta aegis]|nr:hypothetical protein [sulfur-oxidizing endosymbiont of Gigantopelta aegis]